MDGLDGGRVILRVTVQWLVVWLWLGCIVMAVGTALSLLPSVRRQRAQQQTTQMSEVSEAPVAAGVT